MTSRIRYSLLAALLASSIASASSGCNGEATSISPVSGQITFGGGPWPGPASVKFLPFEPPADAPLIPAIANLEADGSFTAESSVGPGLAPGTYRLAVECWKKRPDDLDRAGQSHVPQKYRDPSTSGLTVTVPAEAAVALDVPKE